MDNTRDISEFDAEAQAAIQRVTYDQHMKMQGKPTSSEKVRVHIVPHSGGLSIAVSNTLAEST